MLRGRRRFWYKVYCVSSARGRKKGAYFWRSVKAWVWGVLAGAGWRIKGVWDNDREPEKQNGAASQEAQGDSREA